MEKSPSLEANSHSASQEIPDFYTTWRLITVFTEPATGPYPEPNASSPQFPLYFPKIHSNDVPFMPCSLSGLFPLGFLTKIFYIFMSPMHATFPPHLIFPDLITLIVFVRVNDHISSVWKYCYFMKITSQLTWIRNSVIEPQGPTDLKFSLWGERGVHLDSLHLLNLEWANPPVTLARFGVHIHLTYNFLLFLYILRSLHEMLFYEVSHFHSQVFSKENGRSGGWLSSDDVPISTVDYPICEKLANTFFG